MWGPGISVAATEHWGSSSKGLLSLGMEAPAQAHPLPTLTHGCRANQSLGVSSTNPALASKPWLLHTGPRGADAPSSRFATQSGVAKGCWSRRMSRSARPVPDTSSRFRVPIRKAGSQQRHGQAARPHCLQSQAVQRMPVSSSAGWVHSPPIWGAPGWGETGMTSSVKEPCRQPT